MAYQRHPEGGGSHDSNSIARCGSPNRSPPRSAFGPQDFYQHMAMVFQNLVPASTQRSAIERMAKYRPVDFYGKRGDDPSAAEMWLERTERLFEQMHCTPEQCLECAVSLLQEDAYAWWISIASTVIVNEKTWEFFVAEFRKKYVGRIYLDNMRREFLYLRQKQLSVTEYEREFTRLSKYGREIVATETDKCRRFEDGLNDYIRIQITALQIEDFTRLVSAALNIERVKGEEQARKNRGEKKRNIGQPSENPTFSKKQKGVGSIVIGQSVVPRPSQGQKNRAEQTVASVTNAPRSAARGSNIDPCEHCGRRHGGECRLLKGACFLCGSPDHFMRNCPQTVKTTSQQPERTTPKVNQGGRTGGQTVQRGQLRTTSERASVQGVRTTAQAYVIQRQEEPEESEENEGKLSVLNLNFEDEIS